MSTATDVRTALSDFQVGFTQAGMELFEEEPALEELFSGVIRAESTAVRLDSDTPHEHIGMGLRARVSAVPERNDLCVKASGPHLGKGAWKYGRAITPEDLVLQMRFMDALGSHLNRQTGTGVSAPPYFMAARKDKNSFCIMGRLHHSDTQILGLYLRSQENGGAAHEIIEGRILAAIGGSVLRMGIDDLYDSEHKGRLHGGNVIVDKTKAPEATQISIIDQPSKRKIAARLCMALDGCKLFS